MGKSLFQFNDFSSHFKLFEVNYKGNTERFKRRLPQDISKIFPKFNSFYYSQITVIVYLKNAISSSTF